MTIDLNYGQPLAGPSMNEDKQQKVIGQSAEKQARIDPDAAYANDISKLDPLQLRLKYGDQAVMDQIDYTLGQNQSKRMVSMGRSPSEITKDAGLSVAKGGVGLGGFLSQLAQMAGQGMAVTGQNWNNPEQAIKNMHAVEVGNARTTAAINDAVNGANDALSKAMSRRSQLAAARTGAVIQSEQQDNNAQYEADVAAGMNPILAGAKKIGRGVVNGAAAVTEDPTYFSNFAAEQAPSLMLGPGARLAAVKEVTAGLEKQAAKELLMTDAGKAAVNKAGTRNLMTGIGVTEGTGAGQQTFDSVMQTKPEDLQKNSQEYRDLTQQGYSPEDARAVVAQRAANTALAIQGPAAALTGKIAARFELSPLSGGGATGAGRVLHALSSMGKETLEETLQSGSGQLAQNIATKEHANENQSLTDGVGEQAGMGAVGAMSLAGGAQTPSAVAGAVKVTGKATADLARAGGTAAAEKLKSFAASRTKLDGETQAAADADAQSQTVEAAAQEYAKAEPQADDSAQAAEPEQPAPLPEEEAIAAQQPVPQTATPAGKDRLTKFGRLYEILSSPHIESVSPDNQIQLKANAFHALQGMVAERNQLVQKLEENPDDAVAQKRADALTKAIQSDAAVQVSAYAKENSAALAELVKSGNVIPDIIDQVTPQIEQAARSVQQAATLNPESVPQPLYHKIIGNAKKLGLSPQQVTQLKGAQQIGALAEHKGTDLVNKDVTEGNGNGFVSLREHLENIHGNLAANDVQGAQQSLEGLRKFAQHMTDKSRDFSRAYKQFQANPGAGAVNVVRADGTPYNSLVDAKTGTAKAMTASGKSVKLMEQIHKEAELLVNNYNQVLNDHPALKGAGSEITLPKLDLSNAATAQPAAQTQNSKTELKRESTTGTGVFNGERELTRPEMQDLASGEVTIADLKAKWAEEAKAAEPAAQTDQPAEQIKEPESDPVSAPEVGETRAESAPAAVDTADQTRENTPEPAPAADPVTANQEPVTPPSETAEEPQHATPEPSEPVADSPAASEPVVNEQPVETGAERLLANLTPRLTRERNVDKNESEADHEARVSNAVVKWFDAAKPRTPFTRTTDFVQKLAEAVQTSAEAAGELLGLKEDEVLSQDNLRGLNAVNILNNGFRSTYVKAVQDKLGKVKDLNALPWRNAPILYFTKVEENETTRRSAVSKHATDAIGMAAIKFAIDNLNVPPNTSRDQLAKDLGIEQDQLTAEIMERYQAGAQSFNVLADRLGTSIMRTMGLKARNEAPNNVANGIPLSLAMDALNVLGEMGLARIEEFTLQVNGKPKTFKTLRFVNGEGEMLTGIDEALGSQFDILSRMIDPDSKASAYIDSTPPVGSDRLGRSRVQKISNKLKDSLRTLQQKEFYLNTDLHDLVEGMGYDAVGRMLGVTPEDGLNKVHKESVRGKNVSVKSAITSWQRGMQDLAAKAGDRALGDIPVRFAWSIGSNMRAMMNSSTFNPQRHKLHRELMTGQPRDISLDNSKHVHQFQMAVAQALGEKVDRMSNAEAKANAAATLAKPVFRNAVEVMKAHLGDFSGLQAADVQAITAAVDAAGEGMKSFHGLLAQAKFEHAQENGSGKFTNHLTFELDGKTDGPANALVHFGAVAGDGKFFDMLKKVGLFVNDASSALNVFSKGSEDIYETVAKNINELMKNATSPTMLAQLRLLQLSGNVKMTDVDDIRTATATRNMAKNPVTQTVYSAGDDAKVRSLSKQIQTAVYEQLSQAMQTGTELDAGILDAVIELTGATALRDPQNYKDFEFRQGHQAQLEEQLTHGMGSILNVAIDNVLGDVVQTGKRLAAAAGAQHQFFSRALQKAREAKIQELRKAGELSSFEDLSSDQMQDVYDSVAHLAPVYHNALTSGTNPRDGMLMSKETRGNYTGHKAESVFGDKTDVPGMYFEAPGARPAPMMTISSGDATMMALYFLEHSNALNVFDGLEVMPGDFDAAAAGINKAVFKGWQFGLMNSISESYQKALPFMTPDLLEGMTAAELGDMAKAMKIPKKQIKGLTADALINRIVTEAHSAGVELSMRARNIEAVKNVIFNTLATSTDHMAGHETPVINRPDLAPLDDHELYDEVRKRVTNELHRRDSVNNDGLPQQDLAMDRHLKAANPGKGDAVTQYTKSQVTTALRGYLDEVAGKKARIPQFVLDQIEKHLPDDMTIHIGTRQNIRDYIAEQFPDIPRENALAALGMTYGKQVFIGNRSAETMMHELLHVATQNTLNQYFADPSQLTAEQRNSVTALNRLMNDFLTDSRFAEMEPTTANYKVYAKVQDLLQSLIQSDNRNEALNEFVAWTLTNPHLAETLQETENLNEDTHIFKRVLKLISRLLGIGTGAQSYFTSIAGHFTEVLGPMTTPLSETRAAPLNQLDLDSLNRRLRSERTTRSHQAHLDLTFDRLQSTLINRINTTQQPVAGITTAADRLDFDKLDPAISQAANAFMASGFPMSGQEEMIFKMTQASLQTAFEAKPANAVEARRMFTEASRALSPADLVDGTGSMVMAQMRYDALFGEGLPAAEQLANFLAASQTSELLRDKLRDKFVTPERAGEKTWEDRAVGAVNDAIRWTANLGTGMGRSLEMQKRLDILSKNLTHFEAEAKQNVIVKATSSIGDSLDQVNNYVNQKKANGAKWLAENTDGVTSKIANENARLAASGILRGIAAMGSKRVAGDVAESMLSMINSGAKDKLLNPVQSLMSELIGITDSNRAVLNLLTRAKPLVDKVRQILREQVPEMVAERFSQPLTAQQSSALHSGVGKTDAAALLNHGYQVADVARLYSDSAYRAQEIAAAKQAVTGQHAQTQLDAADALAHFMVTGEVVNQHLLPNAQLIATLAGTKLKVDQSNLQQRVDAIDKLVSLQAIDKLPSQMQQDVAGVMARELKANAAENGATFVLNLMNNLRANEGKRLGTMNTVKGAMHTTFDTHKSVVIATPKQGADLIKRGYIKGAEFRGDPGNVHGVMHYYTSTEGGRPQWNQGAMQTVQATAGGVDPYTGRLRSPVSAPRLTGQQVKIERAKRAGAIYQGRAFKPNGVTNNMRPVFDINGNVSGYEYSVPHAVRDAMLNANTDLGHNLGVWNGRIVEEELSQAFNRQLVKSLHQRYTEDMKTVGREDEFVTINAAHKDPQVREAWSLMPVEMREMVKETFGGDLVVRKDMLDNALGFRRASVNEIWEGNSRLSPTVQNLVYSVASAVMGNDAARQLRKGERFVQEAVSSAKDWIVVRSLVVARDNIISNNIQLMGHGMSPLQIVRKSAEAMTLVDAYQKNERRLNELSLLLNNGADTARHPAYRREMEMLRAENTRSPIHALVMDGHLPTIAEGLSENDDYSLRNDFNGWISRQTSKLPKGVTTAARYALIARGTPIYAGLNRMIQYGDFTAKYALYDHLQTRKREKMDQQEALKMLQDEFVNYSILPSRSRDYLESMGATWFLNYKLRIQKILLRSIRDNPLRFLLTAGAAGAMDIPGVLESNLVTNSTRPNLGWGALFRAHETHPLWWLID